MQPIYFHDVPLPVNAQRGEDSKTWIKIYTNAAKKLIAPLRPSPNFNSLRVNIAVLDTGIDLTDSLIRGAGRIIRCENWGESPNMPTSLGRKPVPLVFGASDHGTHVVAPLLQIAPDCDVHIGRVADATGTTVAPDKIAEAIHYAVKTWEIDIITTSLGFKKFNDVIEL